MGLPTIETDAEEPESTPEIEETITVIGIRAGEEVPVTKTNLDAQEIEKLSYGQDVPQLLQYTPAMTWYSDSGIGSNYSYFQMRGIQQTRINMTFDGAPLNDPAEHAVYFNNFHDFTNTVDSIQIQRGVGTSSVGSPSYGGSVNFASSPPAQDRSGDVRLAVGSYDTTRASLGYESGVSERGFSVGGRFSYADTDGYRNNSGTKHKTGFLDAGWQGDRSSLKLVSFFGEEATQLAWLAVEPEILSVDRRFNPLDEDYTDGEIEENPNVAVVFHWDAQGRQIARLSDWTRLNTGPGFPNFCDAAVAEVRRRKGGRWFRRAGNAPASRRTRRQPALQRYDRNS